MIKILPKINVYKKKNCTCHNYVDVISYFVNNNFFLLRMNVATKHVQITLKIMFKIMFNLFSIKTFLIKFLNYFRITYMKILLIEDFTNLRRLRMVIVVKVITNFFVWS